MRSYDPTTFELTEARLRLKSGLKYSIHASRHGNWYMIEDESRGAFFRVGPAEYSFVSLLNGETTVATAMARTCSLMGSSALTENEAIALCKWLVESGLAQTDASVSANRIEDRRDNVARQKTIQRLNPISVRFPLCNPDKLVTLATQMFGWMVSWPFAMFWLFVCTYALIGVAMDWQRLFHDGIQVFSRNGLLWIGATWMVLKLVHELAHTIACKKFGGKTGNCGILFLLFIPLPFVDVTSAWRFTSKSQRILVSAAGMLAEIFLAALATIVWCHSDAGLVSFYASNVMIAASLHTLVFNANPLMKFDGYHILADWLEIPNLASHGNRYVMDVLRSRFLGLPSDEIRYAGIHGQIIRGYGFAALGWRIMLCCVLAIAAANLFQGIGLLMALMAAVLWLVIPVLKFAKYMIRGSEFEQPDRLRFAKVAGIGGLVITGLLLLVPAPSIITAPIVVQYEGLNTIRNETPGFVRSIQVQADQLVEQGDPLLVLENPELLTRKTGTVLELHKARLRANTQKSQGNIGAWQVELESIAALEKQLRELSDSIESLHICASASGRVIATGLANLPGSYLEAGTEIMSLGKDDCKKAVALISQNDAAHLTRIEGKTVAVRIQGETRVERALVSDVNPRGQLELPHFSFAGIHGGPLPVASRSQLQAARDLDEDELMLIEARVLARLSFDAGSSRRLYSGQTGFVHIRGRSGKLGGYLWNGFCRWIGRNVTTHHGL